MIRHVMNDRANLWRANRLAHILAVELHLVAVQTYLQRVDQPHQALLIFPVYVCTHSGQCHGTIHRAGVQKLAPEAVR